MTIRHILLISIVRANCSSPYPNSKNMREHKELADKVVNWTITNMQDSEGYFYYQLKQFFSSHIPYMRWSNAFMFNALSYYLLEQLQYEK